MAFTLDPEVATALAPMATDRSSSTDLVDRSVHPEIIDPAANQRDWHGKARSR